MDGIDRPLARDGATSRRAVVTGGLGALAALVVGRPAPAVAANGDPVLLGQDNGESRPTSIRNSRRDDTSLHVEARGSGGVAIDGVCHRGTALHGLSTRGSGVSGETVFGIAVSGLAVEPGSYAVAGNANGGVGVQGESREATGVQGTSRYGVGVSGANLSVSDPAVRGWAQSGQTGVMGLSTPVGGDAVATPSNVGVFGVCDQPDGRGVLARSADGMALEAEGRVVFSTSGVATVPSGTAHVVVTPTFDVTQATKVLALPQSDPGGVVVRWVDVAPGTNTFTIRMSGNVGSDTVVAWFALG